MSYAYHASMHVFRFGKIGNGSVTPNSNPKEITWTSLNILEEIIWSSGKSYYLFSIPLKDSHLFKITESIISFCLKNFPNLAILNSWEFFSRMMNHVTCPLWKRYNFSYFRTWSKNRLSTRFLKWFYFILFVKMQNIL